ncbi:MAG: sporulation integral membrane protein YtvI [Angelakisella sp.]|nr:sporulation integral membrane protein YtvI [Angelakisella sp.]
MEAKNFLLRFGVVCAWGLLLYLGMKYLLPCLLPFLVGGAIALMLRPAAHKIQEITRMTWRPSAVATTVLFYGIFGFIIWRLGAMLVTQVSALCMHLPEFYITSVEPLLMRLSTRMGGFLQSISPEAFRDMTTLTESLGGTAREALTVVSSKAMDSIATLAAALPTVALALSFAILSSFFILMDWDTITAFCKNNIPRTLKKPVQDSKGFLLHTGKNILKAYFLLMVITFCEVALGLWLLRVEYYLALGLVVALMDALPVLGSGSILVPWGLCVLACNNIPLGAGILILYAVITVVRSLLEPKILGDKIGLHPLATLLAMYAGMKLFGFWGLILSPVLVTLVMHLSKKGHIHPIT